MQIMLQSLNRVWRHRQESFFVAFAVDSQLGFGQMKIFQLDGQCLLGAQAVVKHQCDQTEIPKSAETPPEAGHLVSRERYDQAARAFQSEAADGAPGPAIAEGAAGGTCGCDPVASWNFASVVETVQAA